MKSLIPVEKLDIAVVFSDKGIVGILAEIEKRAMAHIPDLKTGVGRKDIASMAHRVSRSKVVIDDLGKEVGAEWKKKVDNVNRYRKQARDFCDNLRDKVREPLTAWEAKQAKIKADAEKKERERITFWIDALQAVGVVVPFSEIEGKDDAELSSIMEAATVKFNAEKKAREEEEVELVAERERLEKIQEEQAAKEAELKVKEDAIKLDQAKKDSAEKALAQKAESELKAREGLARQESLKPDKKKLEDLADMLLGITGPDIQDNTARNLLTVCLGSVHEAARDLRAEARGLS